MAAIYALACPMGSPAGLPALRIVWSIGDNSVDDASASALIKGLSGQAHDYVMTGRIASERGRAHEGEMMLLLAFLLLGLALFIYALVSAKAETAAISPPLVLSAVGLAFGLSTNSLAEFAQDATTLRVMAELALGLTLFVDAAALPSKRVFREAALPARLLTIGLPILIAGGAAVAWLIWPGYGLLTALLLSLMLAPTDAVLAQPVLSAKGVPTPIRDGINVESGLNDGLVLPIFLCGILIVEQGAGAHDWFDLLVVPLVIAPIVGAAVGSAGTRLLRLADRRGWMDKPFQRISALAMALVAFTGAELVGGNGFVAAFVAGLATSITSWRSGWRFEAYGQTVSELLSLLAFALFSAVLLPQALDAIDWRVGLYAVLSLVVLRPLAVLVALVATRLSLAEKAYIGWFGPRGAASILYLAIGMEALGLSPSEPVAATVCLTIALSILLHGLTSVPLSNWLAARSKVRWPEERGYDEERPAPD